MAPQRSALLPTQPRTLRGARKTTRLSPVASEQAVLVRQPGIAERVEKALRFVLPRQAPAKDGQIEVGIHSEKPLAMVRGTINAAAHRVTRGQIRLDPELRHVDAIVGSDRFLVLTEMMKTKAFNVPVPVRMIGVKPHCLADPH